jgi:hypothetical protein
MLQEHWEVYLIGPPDGSPNGSPRPDGGRKTSQKEAHRVVLRAVDDVPRRFGELTFSKSMLNDHLVRPTHLPFLYRARSTTLTSVVASRSCSRPTMRRAPHSSTRASLARDSGLSLAGILPCIAASPPAPISSLQARTLSSLLQSTVRFDPPAQHM